MEEKPAKEEGEAEIQELHGPEHWFSKWERQCLAEAEQDDGALPPELQDDDEAAAAAPPQPEHKQQKLWHLFQNSATAVAQLYKGEERGGGRRPGETRVVSCERASLMTRVGAFGRARVCDARARARGGGDAEEGCRRGGERAGLSPPPGPA